MAEHSTIEWTDATWNPVTGCSVVSPGCTNCYAMRLAGTRLQHHPSRKGLTLPSKAGPVWNGEVRLNEEWLPQPLQWKRPRMIFVCAHGDLFHEAVPDAWIDRVFAVMALCPQHTFQVLTKRSARMRAYCTHRDVAHRIAMACGDLMTAGHDPRRNYERAVRHPQDADGWLDPILWNWPLPNIWLGVSAEDQRRADELVPDLIATPAAVRFVSAEPLLGPIDFMTINRPSPLGSISALPCGEEGQGASLDWIIVGGESGPGARPMHPDWARSIRDQCDAAGTAFHFKQWGAWRAELDREAEDRDWRADYGNKLNDRNDDIAWLNLEGGRGFHGERFHVMRRVGKEAAGRLLDGREHNGMPRARP